MLRYKLLYLILLIASLFAFISVFITWLDTDAKNYNLWDSTVRL